MIKRFLLHVSVSILLMLPALVVAQCNGDVELCDKRFNQVAFLTTHNAFNADEDGFNLPNQTYGLTRQLNDGVRGLMIDVYDQDGVPTVYHSVALLGSVPLESNLAEIKGFLDANPNEVVTIIFECYADFLLIETAFLNIGIRDYVHTQGLGEDWPTLQEMIDNDKRLVVLSDRDDASAGENWYHYVWDYAVETPFSNNSNSDFACEFNRGDSQNDLFILNHFATDPNLGTGRTDLSEAANEYSFFYNRCMECWAELGKFPNFPTIDFHELGDGIAVTDSLNSNISVGVLEQTEENPVSVFPNPSRGQFLLSWSESQKAQIQVFDATGKMMFETSVSGNALELDLEEFPVGIYHAIIRNEQSKSAVKLLRLD